MEPHEPPVAPVTDHVPSLTMSFPHPPTVHEFLAYLWRSLDAFFAWIGIPLWVPLALIAGRLVVKCLRAVALFDEREVHPTTSDLRKDSESAASWLDRPAPHDAPRSDRWWRCRFCGERGSLYGTGQQEASVALAHSTKCPSRPGAPPVRRCTECAAPIDPVDGSSGNDEEPGVTGWEPGMPAWGTPPLLPLRNHAQAELFRQMLSDALSRSKGGPV